MVVTGVADPMKPGLVVPFRKACLMGSKGLVLPALKRLIKVEALPGALKRSFPAHECRGSHLDPAVSQFSRSLSKILHSVFRVRIETLTYQPRPMFLLRRSGGRAATWKILSCRPVWSAFRVSCPMQARAQSAR
jgi:hypothetical protein